MADIAIFTARSILARYNHDVKGGRQALLIESKDLTQPAFEPVTYDCAFIDFGGDGNANPRTVGCALRDEYEKVLCVELFPLALHAPELR